jgi:chaperone BCS1
VLTTPAEVAEVLMRNDDVDVALQVLAEFLKAKRNEPGETKAENKNGNQKINKYEQSMV